MAEKESQSLRATADEELARIVRDKAAEVQAKEAELKAQVERLWLKFRHGLEKAQQDRPQPPSSTAPWTSPARANDLRNNGQKAPVAIRDFTPVSVTPPVRSTPPPPRVSALSASLANTNLHQAMADRNNHRSANGSNASEHTSSTHSGSPTLVPPSTNERETASVLQFRRVVDDTINTAASYGYFLNLEEEMARHRKEKEQEAGSDHDETMGIAGPSKPPVNGDKQEPSEATGGDANANVDSNDKEKGKANGPKPKTKHVHFNVQPAVKESKELASRKSQKASKPDPGGWCFHRSTQ